MQNEHIQLLICLKKGHVATKDFYDSIKFQALDAVHWLPVNTTVTLERLCGDTFWSSLTTEERKLAGRCMAHLVEYKLVPLGHVGCKHAYPKRYRLI